MNKQAANDNLKFGVNLTYDVILKKTRTDLELVKILDAY